MGYRNQTIRLEFPELGEDCWVVILNPKMLSQEQLPSIDKSIPDDDQDAQARASMDALGRLIVAWNVWATADLNDPPEVLPIPQLDREALRKVPMEIITRLGEEFAKANPQTPPAPTGDSPS